MQFLLRWAFAHGLFLNLAAAATVTSISTSIITVVPESFVVTSTVTSSAAGGVDRSQWLYQRMNDNWKTWNLEKLVGKVNRLGQYDVYTSH
ncbi:unnamed protein product [Zymoseptoria tritici ST99CH_3D1]|nr:unnamed protein product [Zymoseptoria tritici ST99CH_3D1]